MTREVGSVVGVDVLVPANQILDLAPGEVFVHRNIANVFMHTDFNALSVLQYAVDVLKVRHVIVCGHYGCGGIHASVNNKQFGLIDNWLRNIKDVYITHRRELQDILDEENCCVAASDDHTQTAATPSSTKNPTPTAMKGQEVPTEASDCPKLLRRLCELNVARSLFNVCRTYIVQNAWARNQEVSVHGWCYELSDGIIK